MFKRRLARFYHPLVSWSPHVQLVCRLQTHPLNKGQIKFLAKIFDCNYHTCYGLMSAHIALRTLDQNEILETSQMLEKLGVTKKEMRKYPGLVTLKATLLHHRYMVLEEAGFSSIKAEHLYNYTRLGSRGVMKLKFRRLIPREKDVIESFTSYCEPSMPPVEKVPNDGLKSLFKLNGIVMRHFIRWIFNPTTEEYNQYYKKNENIIGYKSFRLVRRTLQILEEELGFSKEKILKNLPIIRVHPDNILKMINNFKMLKDVDIKLLVYQFPVLLTIPLERIHNISKLVKEHGLRDEMIKACPEVFSLYSDSVHNRLMMVKDIPELYCFSNDKRFLRLIYAINAVLIRIHYLKRVKMRCMSMNTLIEYKPKFFYNFINRGWDRTKGDEVVSFLSVELQGNQNTIRSMLNRNPLWRHVPLVMVKETLDFLLLRCFTKQQILYSVHAVLYPRYLLERELGLLLSREELKDIREDSLNHEMNKSKGCILPEHCLALCVYFIEREHHFTGDGIWGIEFSNENESALSLDMI